MTPFRFRLDALLGLRRHRSRARELAFARARIAEDAGRRELSEGARAIASASRTLEDDLARGVSAAALARTVRGLEGAGARQRELGARAAEAGERAEAARARFAEARAAQRALERLRERRAHEHRRNEERRAQQQLEDQWRSPRVGARLALALLLVVFALPAAAQEAEPPERTPLPADLVPAEPSCQRAERMLVEIQRRQRELEARTREIAERERAIEKVEAALAARADAFTEDRRALEKRLAKLEENLGDQVGRLAKTYASMDAGAAAGLLERLDAVLASSILRRMKHKKSALVLASMSPRRAEQLSRMLARPFDVGAGGKKK